MVLLERIVAIGIRSFVQKRLQKRLFHIFLHMFNESGDKKEKFKGSDLHFHLLLVVSLSSLITYKLSCGCIIVHERQCNVKSGVDILMINMVLQRGQTDRNEFNQLQKR